MSDHTEGDALIHLRVTRQLKNLWVREAQGQGLTLGQYIVARMTRVGDTDMDNKFALIMADLNSGESEIISEHRTEAAAESALEKLGNVRGYYVAHRTASGEFETRLEARDRRERAPAQ